MCVCGMLVVVWVGWGERGTTDATKHNYILFLSEWLPSAKSLLLNFNVYVCLFVSLFTCIYACLFVIFVFVYLPVCSFVSLLLYVFVCLLLIVVCCCWSLGPNGEGDPKGAAVRTFIGYLLSAQRTPSEFCTLFFA